MSKNDSLGDRMKFYEKNFSSEKLMPLLPVLIRLDGVAFHTFTKGLARPYDERLSKLMVDTTKYLTKLTGARVGYTQSDEISLVLFGDEFEDQLFFDGKKSKIISVLAARCSIFFNSLLRYVIPEKADKEPVFDCRVWNVPNKEEAVNSLIWREKDATRNSISMAAQSCYSHSQLQNKSSNEMQELLHQKGINWNDYPTFFKRGTYIQKKIIVRPFTTSELSSLPAKHEAHANPNLTISRTDFAEVDMPILTKIVNRAGVVFDGETPQLQNDLVIEIK